MHQLGQEERLRSFIRNAVEWPHATIESITVDPDDYPPPFRTVVRGFHHAVQDFLQELQEIAVAMGKVDKRSDKSVESCTPGGLDLLAKASAQAQAIEPALHTGSAAESADNTARTPVRDDGTSPESVSIRVSPLVDSAHVPTSPPPPPWVTTAQESTTASTKKIRSDTEENVLRLYPTKAQYLDFPSLLTRAKELGAENTGVFTVVLPEDMPQDFDVVDSDDCPVSVFAATKKTDGVFQVDPTPRQASLRMTPDPAEAMTAQVLEEFEAVLEDASGLDGVAYCTDYDAKTPHDRHDLGLPEQSPIWPLPGNELDRTAKPIAGIHHPFGYKSDAHFGAPFVLQKEDCDLVSLNVLYYGCKVWTVVAPHHSSLVEQKHKSIWKHRYTCAQGLRHCSTWVLPRTLTEWGANPVTLRQQPNEVVVVLPGAYHQGFCIGSTLGEAVNYAPLGWSIVGYAGCSANCPGQPIPHEHMAFRRPDELQQSLNQTDGEQDDDLQNDTEGDGASNDMAEMQLAPSPETSKPAAGAESRRPASVTKRQRPPGRSVQRNTKMVKLDWPPSVGATVGTTKAEATASQRHGRVSAGDSQGRFAGASPTENQQAERVTAMAQAVGSPSAFRVLKDVLVALPQHGQRVHHHLGVDDPKTLIGVVELAQTSGALNCYQRRFALARLAQVYNLACQQYGQKFAIVRKMDKAAAYETMIERTWGCPFPHEHRGTSKTQNGLINAETTAAVRWNKHKSKLVRFLDAGQRWLGLVDQHGWSVLALIAPDWDTSESRLNVTDSVFEQKLTRNEYEQLVHKVTTHRRRFLQDMRKTDVSVMDVLIDPTRVQNRELLQAVDDSSADNDEGRIVQLLQSAK
ncbi:hypothetical protein LTR70_010339 [Exophiala xenobiotica]|uniref:JmjC domain-containing protein n=1 Tax=Lithohypha guttulata TaxID=1690604 RepID=A0ABR0JTT8_9EURO|nr:hypothetical protein LTR24_010461 [Lithohypha guttulata]KAK5309379.1 hypothetical protein LTR70_010339 [Exophiala xenobiotica]